MRNLKFIFSIQIERILTVTKNKVIIPVNHIYLEISLSTSKKAMLNNKKLIGNAIENPVSPKIKRRMILENYLILDFLLLLYSIKHFKICFTNVQICSIR